MRGLAAPNLSLWAMQHRALMLFGMLLLAVAGVWAYLGLGRAEDPPFTIKEMIVAVDWPGASADEMSRQVTDRIERKLEDLPRLDHTESQTQPGHAVVRVMLRDDTPPRLVGDLFYQVRKKVNDIKGTLPEGVQGPYFDDEFGDTFGIVYALTGDGFSLPELKHIAEDVRERLLSVPGVGKVMLIGQQQEQINIEVSYRKLAELGLTLPELFDAIRRENTVVAGGFVDTAHDRIHVRTRSALQAAEALQALPISAHGRLLRLGDIASISRGTADPPASTMRYDGRPALGIGVSMAEGGNMLALGKLIAARMAEVEPTLPLGVEVGRLHDQSVVVASDVGDFESSFVDALRIVLAVTFISLGWRSGIVVAISVPLVLAGVFLGMKLLGIDLQRISLGAMVIALGLLVDDAIIAVETMVVKLEQGWDRLRAGSFAYTSTAMPMLTGTLVTAAGYLPVGLAQSGTGEYTRDIFRVVGLSLVLSWFVAVLFVPLIGATLLPKPKHRIPGHDVYDKWMYRIFGRLVGWCVRWRWTVIGLTLAAFGASIAGFTWVPQQFFPASDRLELLVDMRLPEGSSFAATAAEVARLEAMLKQQPGVTSYAAYTGTGTPRFFLAFSPELDQPNYAQVVVNTADIPAREALMQALTAAMDRGDFPDVRLRPWRLELGPPVGYPVQFRIMGPDPMRLRQIAGDVQRAIRGSPVIRNISGNWGQMGKQATITLDQDKARLLGLSSEAVATTLQTLQQGATVTQYREGTDLIPVVAKAIPSERQDIGGIGDVTVASANGHIVPLAQVAAVTWGLEQPVAWRRDRTPMLVVHAETVPGVQAPDATAAVLPLLADVKAALPRGYVIETAGAVEESAKGSASINKVMPLMLVAMLSLLMVQMQSFARVLMVVATAPLGLIGVTAALLATGAPFGFVATLGCIALAGIIMRNSVILVDQIDRDIREGVPASEAIVGATVRRSRPIVLTAAAAILALVPLSFSIFWGPMAIAIMGGLVGATVLTLFFVPALYAVVARVGAKARQRTGVVVVRPAE